MNKFRTWIPVYGNNESRLERLRMAGDSFNVIAATLEGLKQKNNGLLHGKSGLRPRLTSVAILQPDLHRIGELNIEQRQY
ncbi:MAG: hypothetical protein ABJB85_06795 [Nitrososphaerota archaeon]